MRGVLGPVSFIMGKGSGKDAALIADGRFSGGSQFSLEFHTRCGKGGS